VTEIVEIKGRGHALTIDSGCREVAGTALGFVKRFTWRRSARRTRWPPPGRRTWTLAIIYKAWLSLRSPAGRQPVADDLAAGGLQRGGGTLGGEVTAGAAWDQVHQQPVDGLGAPCDQVLAPPGQQVQPHPSKSTTTWDAHQHEVLRIDG
jgi:hypothetical protein